MNAPEHYSPSLLRDLSRVAGRWRAQLNPPVFAALYFLHWQIALYGQGFASRKHKADSRPNAAEWVGALALRDTGALHDRLRVYLERYQFRGVIANVPIALSRWLCGDWPLELREDIPSARAMLGAQARGTRPVTVIAAYPRMLRPVLSKPNAFAFFLHDLEHAYKFFHSPALYAGQRTFFAALEAAVERGVFTPYFDDPVFVDKFNYLMSDMNTHPQHSRQYLRAILIEFYLRREGKALTAPLDAPAQRTVDALMRDIHDGLRPELPRGGKANGDKALHFTA